MDIKQLTYFIAIAESKTITEAAKKLYLAQSALSQSLKSLEEIVGAPLINRSRRQHTLTSAGEILYNEAKKIIETIEATKKKISLSSNKVFEKINVGVDPISSHLLLPALREMKNEYPNMTINIQQNDSRLLTQMVMKNELDFALVGLPINPSYLEVIVLEKKPLYFICSKSDKKRTSIGNLPRRMIKPLILPNTQEVGTYQRIMEHVKMNSESIASVSGCSDIDLLLTMVEEDLGCSIVPESFLTKTNYEIDVLSISEPDLTVTSGLIYSKELKLTEHLSRFIESLAES
ncbi:MAG: LysR family transcriptional regulator [Vagococcus salmoninarum]|uniref:LysR family transcriptional regulator n=1 Tax=Vagococcus salmoninarum TaxID=2739 RepID=UPI003F9CAD8C